MPTTYAVLSDITPNWADVESLHTNANAAAEASGDNQPVAIVPAGTVADARIRLSVVQVIDDTSAWMAR